MYNCPFVNNLCTCSQNLGGDSMFDFSTCCFSVLKESLLQKLWKLPRNSVDSFTDHTIPVAVVMVWWSRCRHHPVWYRQGEKLQQLGQKQLRPDAAEPRGIRPGPRQYRWVSTSTLPRIQMYQNRNSNYMQIDSNFGKTKKVWHNSLTVGSLQSIIALWTLVLVWILIVFASSVLLLLCRLLLMFAIFYFYSDSNFG